MTLGRVAGVEIGINWSWLIVVALIVWSLSAAVFPDENPGLPDGTYAAMAFVAALLFFASLLLHELGHAVVARREGMRIDGITLWEFGGVARFTGMFPSAGAEFRIAIAAGALGKAFGLALIWGGITLALIAGAPGGLWLALIGWFVYGAAGAETSLATIQQLLEGLRVADAMASKPAAVSADASLQDFVERVFPGTRHAAYPVTSAGVVVGLLPFRTVTTVPRAEWPTTRVRESMLPLEQTLVLSPDGELGPAAMELVQDGVGRALVVDGARLAGLLSITDVSRLLELRRASEPHA